MNKAFLAAIATTVAATSYTTVVEASLYDDIPANHTYYDTLVWAKDRGIIKGFADGTFKPNAFITEAQFALMLTRLIDRTVLQQAQQSNDERDMAYHYLATLGVTFTSTQLDDVQLRNEPFTRLDVAKAFYTAVEGEVPSDKEAIDWMYANGLSKGKGVSADKYVDFGGGDALKRAHAAQFFRNFYTKVFAERMYIDKTAYTKIEIEQLQRQPIAPVYADLNGDGVDELVMYHAINTYDHVAPVAYTSFKTDHYFAVYTFDEATNAYHFHAGTTLFNVQPTKLERLTQQGHDDVVVAFTDAQSMTNFSVLTDAVQMSAPSNSFERASWVVDGDTLYVTDDLGTQYAYTFVDGALQLK